MPPGEYGYEPEDEEPPPDDLPERPDIVKIGCTVLGVMAILLAFFYIKALGNHPADDADVYSSSERDALGGWLAKHDKGSSWLDPVRANISAERVFFVGAENECRVYRLQGVQIQKCMDLLQPALKAAGMQSADPYDFKLSKVTPQDSLFMAMFQKDNFAETVRIETSSADIVVVDNITTSAVVAADCSQVKSELGFDPIRNRETLDVVRLTPAKD
jgi:hypothetical protein